MRINRIQPQQPTFKSHLHISANNNKECQFLYNKVLDIVNKEKLPAEFSNSGIKLNRFTNKVKELLTELHIKFEEKK